MAEQEFLVSFAVEIDEGGLDKMQQALQQNREMAEQLAGAFESAQGAISAFFDQLSASTLSTGEISPWQRLQEMSEEGISVSFEVDFSQAQSDLDEFLQAAQEPLLQAYDVDFSSAEDGLASFRQAAEEPLSLLADASMVLSEGQAALSALEQDYSGTLLPLNADASGILSAGQGALAELQSLFASTTITVKVQADTSGLPQSSGGSPTTAPAGSPVASVLRAATGGRFTSPTRLEIAEDGDPEYVVPVRKESMAVPLLQQIFSELSQGAKETLRNGMGNPARVSDLPRVLSAAPAAAAPVVSQHTRTSVQAPVSIEVNARDADPREVGQSVYDLAERFLLRTLQADAP